MCVCLVFFSRFSLQLQSCRTLLNTEVKVNRNHEKEKKYEMEFRCVLLMHDNLYLTLVRPCVHWHVAKWLKIVNVLVCTCFERKSKVETQNNYQQLLHIWELSKRKYMPKKDSKTHFIFLSNHKNMIVETSTFLLKQEQIANYWLQRLHKISAVFSHCNRNYGLFGRKLHQTHGNFQTFAIDT